MVLHTYPTILHRTRSSTPPYIKNGGTEGGYYHSQVGTQ